MSVEGLCAAIREDSLSKVKEILAPNRWLIHRAHPRFGTPLRVACCGANLELVRFLLDTGAPVNQTTPGGATVLFWACFHQRTPTVRLLLDRGADAARCQKNGLTPLVVAACNGSLEIVEALLQQLGHHAKLAEMLSQALWGALSFDRPQVLRLLLSLGADFTEANHKAKKPIEFARFKGFRECERLLQECERVYLLCKARTLHDHALSLSRRAKPSPPPPTDAEECGSGMEMEDCVPMDVCAELQPQWACLPAYMQHRLCRSLPLPRVEVDGGCMGQRTAELAKGGRVGERKVRAIETGLAVATFVHATANDDVFRDLLGYMGV